jgi:hypothetical protein
MNLSWVFDKDKRPSYPISYTVSVSILFANWKENKREGVDLYGRVGAVF